MTFYTYKRVRTCYITDCGSLFQLFIEIKYGPETSSEIFISMEYNTIILSEINSRHQLMLVAELLPALCRTP